LVGGSVKAHLDSIKQAVREHLKWQEYKRLVCIPATSLTLLPQAALFPKGEPDGVPDVYLMYRDCVDWGRLWWEGGMADQPHFLMLEFTACRTAEREFATIDSPYLEGLASK
jgi:hypothetical protein